MTSRTRLWVLAISTPVIVFALVGGYLGQAMAKDDTYQHLRVFDDVVTHVVNNYVEEVDLKQAMRGAMRGLAEALDADSAFLTPDLVKHRRKQHERRPGGCRHRARPAVLPARRVGARRLTGGQGRPPHRRLHPRDRQQAHTRHVGVRRRAAAARRARARRSRCSSFRGNAADPHEITLVRERIAGPELTSRMANATTGYVRIVDFTQGVAGPDQAGLRRAGQDRRHALRDRSARHGARRSRRRHRGGAAVRAQPARSTVQADEDRARRRRRRRRPTRVITAPVELLVDQGTAAAAEVFAVGARRQRSRGARRRAHARPRRAPAAREAARWQRTAAVVDRATSRRRTKASTSADSAPDVEVDQPDVEFGATPPAKDETLDKALERLAEKKAA